MKTKSILTAPVVRKRFSLVAANERSRRRAHKVTHVGMEATGVYWKPVWHGLERSLELLLGNAAQIRNVPGRKTDVRDADLLAHGLIAPRVKEGGPRCGGFDHHSRESSDLHRARFHERGRFGMGSYCAGGRRMR